MPTIIPVTYLNVEIGVQEKHPVVKHMNIKAGITFTVTSESFSHSLQVDLEMLV